MRNLRRQRDELILILGRDVFKEIQWRFKCDRPDNFNIHYIASKWSIGRVLYIPYKYKGITITLDMYDRLELQRKSGEDFNLVFGTSK